MGTRTRGATDVAGQGRETAADVRSSVARVGLVGRAMLYGVFGLLAIDIARGGGDGASSTQGAIESVVGQSYGQILLILLVIGLVALVVWKVTQAIAGDPVEGSETSDRVKFAIKAGVYAAAAAAAIAVLAANWGSSSGSSSQSGGGGGTKQETTATVLEWPGGRFIVIAVGLGVLAYAGYEFYKYAVNAEFMQRLRSVDDSTDKVIETAGRAGYGAKGIITAIVGVFFVGAGVQHDPSEAKGISGALQELADESWGTALLWVIGIGLILFALFTLVEAWLRRTT